MKSTILNIKKRVLVVEAPSKFKGSEIINDNSGLNTISLKIYKDDDTFWSFPIEVKGKLSFICKGSSITEEIASQYVENFCADMNIPAYRNYAVKPEDLEDDHWAHVANDALDSFISAIEASGHYWEKNPIEKPKEEYFTYQFDVVKGAETFDGDSYDVELRIFEKYESLTFHPDQTLIFEIL